MTTIHITKDSFPNSKLNPTKKVFLSIGQYKLRLQTVRNTNHRNGRMVRYPSPDD